MPIFETENIRLGASILALLPETTFRLTGESSLKTFQISYKPFDEKFLENIVADFQARSLTVNVADYNRHLSRLRDALFNVGVSIRESQKIRPKGGSRL